MSTPSRIMPLTLRITLAIGSLAGAALLIFGAVQLAATLSPQNTRLVMWGVIGAIGLVATGVAIVSFGGRPERHLERRVAVPILAATHLAVATALIDATVSLPDWVDITMALIYLGMALWAVRVTWQVLRGKNA